MKTFADNYGFKTCCGDVPPVVKDKDGWFLVRCQTCRKQVIRFTLGETRRKWNSVRGNNMKTVKKAKPEAITIKKVENCARCKRNHKDVRFEVFKHPVIAGPMNNDLYTHWAPCPTNGQPILMAIEVVL